MKRLTRKLNENELLSSYPKNKAPTDLLKEIKLSKLEDIEEELGIDLITLYKASKYGIYVIIEGSKEVKHIYPDFNYSCPRFVMRETYYSYYPKDYGKTWALRKEDLKWQ